MARINYRDLAKLTEAHGAEKTCEFLSECFDTNQMDPSDFSLRDLFEAVVPDGREALQLYDPRYSNGYTALREAAAVNTAAFSNITGQIAYSTILEAYQNPAFVFSALIPTQSTRFSGEKIPGVTNLGDDASIVAEGKPYPTVGVSEDYVTTPETLKRGLIVPVTKEAVFFDRTNLVLSRAKEVGDALGTSKEKRLVDLVCGVTTLVYNWRGQTYNTYVDTPWDNLSASTALVSWNSINSAEQLLNDMTNPDTGEPIMAMPDTIIVPQALKATAMRITTATEVRELTNSNATTTLSASPLSSYQIVTSPWVKARVGDATTWFIGQPTKAFAYMENWPITVTQAPPNSDAEFTSDIVAQFKASERGAAAVLNPRFMVKCTA